jgi:K+-transporting ATPase KdpF subunit
MCIASLHSVLGRPSERFDGTCRDGELWRCVVAAPRRGHTIIHGITKMSGVELIGLVLSLLLFVYLFVALLKPEIFG